MKLARALLLLWFTCASIACSLLVDPERKAPRCVLTEGVPDPCPAGRVCRSGRCEPLGCGSVENCGDGVDDDCDGKIDERIDDAEEVCGDRKDNDCDGKVDEREDTNIGEICGNGLDDDCDSRFDEGHDQDSDGTPWCGNASAAGGGDTADCDDFDPSVHPGLDEILRRARQRLRYPRRRDHQQAAL
ncbi:MAG: MopE-related protein [Myxococcales bacterium]